MRFGSNLQSVRILDCELSEVDQVPDVAHRHLAQRCRPDIDFGTADKTISESDRIGNRCAVNAGRYFERLQ